MVVPLLIVAVGMASWIFSLRADIDVVIDQVAEVSLDTARVNATSDEADQELIERVGELEEMITEIERVQSVITNEYRTIMADHNGFSETLERMKCPERYRRESAGSTGAMVNDKKRGPLADRNAEV
jgi:hypothetical protein